MSTMTETLKNEEALFIPSENGETEREEYIPKVAGEYLGHITDARTLTREFTKDGRTFKARIFNFKVHVAPENKTMTYTLTNTDGTNGSHAAGGDELFDTTNAIGRFPASISKAVASVKDALKRDEPFACPLVPLLPSFLTIKIAPSVL